MNYTQKAEYYDKFSCIAGRCPFTCCRGWIIAVDPDTYHSWKSKDQPSGYLCRNVITKKSRKETECYIKLGHNAFCPFFNEKGLCNIVINYNEEDQPKTCRVFPRQENSFGDLSEVSLSCACPAVVDIINDNAGKIKFLYEGEGNIRVNMPLGYKIREAMMDIMQNSKFSLKDRTLLVFYMLSALKEELIITKESISRYQDEKYLLSLTGLWSGTGINQEDSFRETSELFLDIVQNYKKEESYRGYLQEISDLDEGLVIENSHTMWNDFEIVFAQYAGLMENYIVSKIFANCISDDISEMILTFQIVITEYLMVRHSTFLKRQLDKKEVCYKDIRNYIVIYSRIIGYNADGMSEFWKDSFDEAVWDFGYILLLI